MHFESNLQTSEDIRENSYLLLFYNDEILVTEQSGTIHIPTVFNTRILNTTTTALQYCGSLRGNAYYGSNMCSKNEFPGFSFIKLKQLHEYIVGDFLEIAFRTFHIMHWLKTNKFCGCCGEVMQVVVQPQELTAKCLTCGYIVYPRISPAIIVAVIKEDEILLARSNRFPPGRAATRSPA